MTETTDTTDYDPVGCPVSDCTYQDAVRSVAAHVTRSDDDDHSWDRLGYDGARDFVMTEKRRQTGDSDPKRPTAESGFESASQMSESDETDEPDEFELGFERDALVLLELASEYNLRSLDDLGTGQLADLYSLLADLKNSADDARKEVRDALLDELHEDGTISADLGSVNRATYEYQRVEDEAAVRDAVEAAGVDPESVRSFDKSKLRDAVEAGELDADSVFEVEERQQIRITGSNDERRQRLFDRLDPEIRSLVRENR